MELDNTILTDSSQYGIYRLHVYMKLKDLSDQFSTSGISEVSTLIDRQFPSTKSYSISKFKFKLDSLINDLRTANFEFKDDSDLTFLQGFISILEEFSSSLSKFTLEQTNMSKEVYPEIMHIVSSESLENTFYVNFTLKNENINVEVLEMSNGSFDAKVIAKSVNGKRLDFEIVDEGNLYKAIVNKIVSEVSLQEEYKKKDYVKDYLQNYYKVTKKEDKFYKLKNAHGTRLSLPKEDFECISVKVGKVEGRKALKEDVSAGSVVATPDGKGKVQKVDGDNVWVKVDNVTKVGDKSYPSGSVIAYKNASLVKEGMTNIDRVSSTKVVVKYNSRVAAFEAIAPVIDKFINLAERNSSDAILFLKANSVSVKGLNESPIQLDPDELEMLVGDVYELVKPKADSLGFGNLDHYKLKGMVLDYLNLGLASAKELADAIEQDMIKFAGK